MGVGVGVVPENTAWVWVPENTYVEPPCGCGSEQLGCESQELQRGRMVVGPTHHLCRAATWA